MIDSDTHLRRYMSYIDLNIMVRAGVVAHPSEWEWWGYAAKSDDVVRPRTNNVARPMNRTGRIPEDDYADEYEYDRGPCQSGLSITVLATCSVCPVLSARPIRLP